MPGKFYIRIPLEGDTLAEARNHRNQLAESNDGSEAIANAKVLEE